MPNRHDDEARRRGVYRELNDQLAQLDSTFHASKPAATIRVTLRCECGNPACVRAIPMMLSDYERVRAEPRRSVIAPNHEDPEVEVVIGGDRFHSVVETFAGAASRIPVDTDPRRRASLKQTKHSNARPPIDANAEGDRWIA
jgi:hypothetical protein